MKQTALWPGLLSRTSGAAMALGCLAMRTAPGQAGKNGRRGFRWLPELDRLLLVGIQQGGAVKRDVIDKIIKASRNELTRGDCWKRIRHLRWTAPAVAVEAADPAPPTRSKRASSPVATRRRWTPAEDDKLLAWTGYEPVTRIAQRLGRSPAAVRSRLGALGVSAKVKDGWSLRAMRRMLRISFARLREFIGAGWLRIRDARIPLESLARFAQSHAHLLEQPALERVAAAAAAGTGACSWERAAASLGVELTQLQAWISAGRLKVLDPFVTERNFQEFCKKHGHEINLALIDPATRKWLAEGYGLPVPTGQDGASVSCRQKHALRLRKCRCGRRIAGNVYFKHVKSCNAVGVPLPDRKIS